MHMKTGPSNENRPQLFKGWIMLSIGWIARQWTMQYVLLSFISWIAIYVLDSVIHPLFNWAQCGYYNLNKVYIGKEWILKDYDLLNSSINRFDIYLGTLFKTNLKPLILVLLKIAWKCVHCLINLWTEMKCAVLNIFTFRMGQVISKILTSIS